MQQKDKLKAIVATLAQLDSKTMEDKARELGISRTTLWRWSKKANVRKELEKYIDGEVLMMAVNLFQQMMAYGMKGDIVSRKGLIATKLFFGMLGMTDKSIAERVRRLADDGITPEIYKQLYSRITKSYPTPSNFSQE
jgi:biotin operon repressor